MKKKILVVALVVCVLVLSIASATIAYFTDTESATNTFTLGDVDITLSEINPATGVLAVVTGEEGNTGFQYTNKYPGQTFAKQPTITNVAKDAAYVAGIITLGSGEKASVNAQLKTDAEVKAFLAGGALNAATGYSTKIVRDTTADTITIYIIATAPLAKDGTVVLFENVVIPAGWDRAEMEKFAELTISVQAYAVQTAGFDTAEAAIEAAFSTTDDGYESNTHFDGYFATTNP